MTNEFVRISTTYKHSQKLIVKSFSDEKSYLRELNANLILKDTFAPIPDLVWFGKSKRVWQIVFEHISGVDGTDIFQNSAPHLTKLLVESAALSLAQFHLASRKLDDSQLQSLNIGFNVRNNKKLWQQVLASQFDKWMLRLEPKSISEIGGKRVLDSITDRVRQITEPSNLGILHCDFSFRNLIFKQEDEAVIIDLGAALYGDPSYDLAKIIWLDLGGLDSSLSNSFVETWTQNSDMVANRKSLCLYGAVQCIAAISWVDKSKTRDLNDLEFRSKALFYLSGFVMSL